MATASVDQNWCTDIFFGIGSTDENISCFDLVIRVEIYASRNCFIFILPEGSPCHRADLDDSPFRQGCGTRFAPE
jgi:hypothetical protein